MMGLSFYAAASRRLRRDPSERKPKPKQDTDESYCGWKIHFIHHRVGVTVHRHQVGVTLQPPNHGKTIYLRGFSNDRDARRAARQRIEAESSAY